MKRKITLLAVFTTIFFAGFAQQIPNGSFENWANANNPVSWTSAEDLAGELIVIDTSIFTFKDTTTFTQGSASLKLKTDTVNGLYSSAIGVETGVISLGTGALDANFNPQFAGIPFTYRPDSLIFDYKMISPGTDTSFVYIGLTRQTVNVVNFGAYLFADTSWSHIALPLTPYYAANEYPDTLLIQFISSQGQNPIIGTTLHIDGVHFGYINQPLSVVSNTSTALCSAQDSVTFQASDGGSTGYTYQWNLGGTPITGATNSSYSANQLGTFSVTIDSSGTSATSQPLVVTLDNVVAYLPGLNDTVCSNGSAISLHGSTPTGGAYSGPGVSSSTFTPSSTVLGLDTVKYTVTDQNGCVKVAAATVLVETCTGISTISSTDLSVYPNPATTLLNINSNTSLDGFNLQMFDLLGRAVLNQVLEGSYNAINVSKLGNGTYIYRITDKENNVVSLSKFDVVK